MNQNTKSGNLCLCVSKRLGSLFILLLLAFVLIGCTGSQNNIDRAERKWNRKGISNYSIRVRVTGFWDQQEYTVVVREGKVVDSSSACTPAGSVEPCCTACFRSEDFTVPGLFAAARAKADASTITFDPEYGFPLTILYDIPGLNDEEQEWRVLEFHPASP